MKLLRKIFLNDHIILSVILLNSVILFIQESGYNPLWIQIVELVCTLIFFLEMTVKHVEYGLRGYWKDGWNRFDGTLVILSIPSVIGFFFPNFLSSLSVLLVLRILRVFRFFRLLHFFPNFTVILKNIRLAMQQSFSVFVGYLIILLIFGLINCSLFSTVSPQYFSTPLDAIYSTFRICTVEGWYEIPDSIVRGINPVYVHIIRIYFCSLLFAGGIIGLSIVNSIFVDAMVSDNNDDVIKKIDALNKKIDDLNQQLANKQ